MHDGPVKETTNTKLGRKVLHILRILHDILLAVRLAFAAVVSVIHAAGLRENIRRNTAAHFRSYTIAATIPVAVTPCLIVSLFS